jgi:membrane protein DedA with SNARE-associated domain
VPIIVSAILAAAGHLQKWRGLAALLFGVMLGDSVMFLLGKRWGDGVLDHRFARRMLSPDRRVKIAGYFRRYGAWIIFAARFLPGLRAPLFLTSGSMGVSFWTFFAMDGAAALLSIPASYLLAYYFADRIDEFLDLSHRAQHWTAGLIVAAVALSLGVHFAFSKIRAKRAQAAAASQPPVPTAASDPQSPPANQSAPAPGSETPVA